MTTIEKMSSFRKHSRIKLKELTELQNSICSYPVLHAFFHYWLVKRNLRFTQVYNGMVTENKHFLHGEWLFRSDANLFLEYNGAEEAVINDETDNMETKLDVLIEDTKGAKLEEMALYVNSKLGSNTVYNKT